jgi:hypothetical protein
MSPRVGLVLPRLTYCCDLSVEDGEVGDLAEAAAGIDHLAALNQDVVKTSALSAHRLAQKRGGAKRAQQRSASHHPLR